jgi:hypothetical protein
MSIYTSIEALEMFTQGKRLRRKGWGDTYAHIESNGVDGVLYRNIVQVNDLGGGLHKTSLSMTDLLSNDWEIAPNEIPCRCCKTIVKRW